MGLRLLILINLILFLAGYSGAQEQDAAEKVKSLMEACQFSQAVNLAEQFLKQDSTNIKVLNELMHVYRQLGNPDKAIAICRKISSLVPDNRYFSLQLANLYYSEEDYRQALKALVPLYLSDSSSFFVARQMGNCYNELKRSDSAIRFYRRALRITPYDPYVTGKLVNVYIREDELAMALYVTQVFLQQDSANISILKQSVECFIQRFWTTQTKFICLP